MRQTTTLGGVQSNYLGRENNRARRRAGDMAARPMLGLTVFMGFSGPVPKLCQWIEDEPSADDCCKCGAPVTRTKDGARKPYCEEHEARAWARGKKNRSKAALPWWARQ